MTEPNPTKTAFVKWPDDEAGRWMTLLGVENPELLCEYCDGKGGIWYADDAQDGAYWNTCPMCDGTRKAKPRRIKCPNCTVGRITRTASIDKCWRCDGKGWFTGNRE